MAIGDGSGATPANALSELRHLLSTRFGWEPAAEGTDEPFEHWTHEHYAERIFLPTIPKRDFWLHVNESLAILAAQSDVARSELEWLIEFADHDRLTSRIAGASVIHYHEELVRRKALGDLLEFAARARITPKPLFGSGGKPSEVSEYISNVFATPTVTGSYVYRILLPHGDPDEEHVDPSENMYRQFNMTAAASIGAAVNAASSVASGRSIDAWDRAVEDGVSANLCDALATHVGGPNLGFGIEQNQVDLHFDYWSTHVPAAARTFRISSDLAVGIEAGAAYLRGESEGTTIQIDGKVSTLSHHRTIVVEGSETSSDSDNLRRYSFDVDTPSHDELAEAYKTGADVRVTLDVTRAPTGKVENVAMRNYEIRDVAKD